MRLRADVELDPDENSDWFGLVVAQRGLMSGQKQAKNERGALMSDKNGQPKWVSEDTFTKIAWYYTQAQFDDADKSHAQ